MSGLLDLPAPLLTAVDGALSVLAIPALARVALYAILSGWLCMAIYRRLSRQKELRRVAEQSLAVRRELASYDGPFDGLLVHIRKLFTLNALHLRLSFVPALLSGLPVLLLLPWLSNTFSLQLPEPGRLIALQPKGIEAPLDQFRWNHPSVIWDESSRHWLLPWPNADQSIELRQKQLLLLSLPLPALADVVHRRQPWFNWLISNPAGYLPDAGALEAVRLDLPAKELHSLGPSWLRGWIASYFAIVLLVSLFWRWRWKLN